MAALPYIQLYIADYLADTMHLQAEEHGAYLLLIFNYWQTAKPIPKNRLQAIARVSSDRWTDVERSLNEFFNDTGTHWQHDRIDDDLLRVEEKQDQAVKAGKASAAARKAKNKPKGNNESTDVQAGDATDVGFPLEQNGNHKDTDTDTDTDTDIKTYAGISEEIADAPPDGSDFKNIPVQKIVDLYHEVLPELPKTAVLTESRRSQIRARWKEHKTMRSLDRWRDFFEYVRESDFLMGRAEPRNGGSVFFADLEFLTNATKFVRIVEKKYHEKR